MNSNSTQNNIQQKPKNLKTYYANNILSKTSCVSMLINLKH